MKTNKLKSDCKRYENQGVHSDQPQPQVDLLWVVTIIVEDLDKVMNSGQL